MKKEQNNCKYCGKKIHRLDFQTYDGYWGKCREILDWKKILSDLKELKNDIVFKIL